MRRCKANPDTVRKEEPDTRRAEATVALGRWWTKRKGEIAQGNRAWLTVRLKKQGPVRTSVPQKAEMLWLRYMLASLEQVEQMRALGLPVPERTLGRVALLRRSHGRIPKGGTEPWSNIFWGETPPPQAKAGA